MAKQSRIPGMITRRLFILPKIRDDDSPERKNALAVRNACATEGRCPCCRVVGEITPDPVLAGLWHYTFGHEDWCVVLADEDAA
jgi:hypothetical protein